MGQFLQHPVYKPVTIYRDDGCMAWCIKKEKIIYMANVWVHEDKRNQGVARNMMKEIKNHFQDFEIHTDYTNESKPFWKKMEAEGIINKTIKERIDFNWIKKS